MTNGEKIKQAFPDLQIDIGELEVYMWTTAHDAIDIPLEWWNAEYKEPTTKNCRTCRNQGSHNGVCDICKKYSCWTEIEPTNKNDLGVEKIVDVLGSYTDLDIPYKHKIAEDILNNLPSVTPQPKYGIWQQINKNEVNVIPEYRCSNCGAEFKGFGFDFDYCPRCGSVMEDEE